MKVENHPRRKAISGIFASLIFFALLFSVGLFYTISSIRLTNSNALAIGAKSAESLVLRSCDSSNNKLPSVNPYTPPGCTVSDSHVGVWVQNSGSAAVTIAGMWIVDSTTNVLKVPPATPPVPNTSPALPLTVSPGSVTVIDTSQALVTSDKFAITFITSLGNLFSTTYPPAPINIQGQTSLTTTLSQTVVNSPPGGAVFDVATLQGATTSAGGTMTFYYFSPSQTCPNPTPGNPSPAQNSTAGAAVAVSGNGNYQSSPVTFTLPLGTWYWAATYSGDSNGNRRMTSPCEPLLLQPPPSPPIGCIPGPTQNCFATTSAGLGSLSFDFDSFKWYSSGACSPQGSSPYAVIGQNPKSPACTLGDGLSGTFGPNGVKNAPRAYTIDQTGMSNSGTNLWFSINVTNADPAGRNIVLDQFTQVWLAWFCPDQLGSNGACKVLGGPHGQIATTYYGLVNVNAGASSTATPAVTLLGPTGCITTNGVTTCTTPGQSATIYFGLQDSAGGTLPGIPLCGVGSAAPYTSQITPVFAFFHGTVGGLSWGLDFPLATILWTNIGSTC